MKIKSCLVFLFALVFLNKNYSQDWTHYVRTSGHGCEIDQIPGIMNDTRQTHLFGIEVDNDITGRYDSFLYPGQKLEAIRIMADSAQAANNFAFVYTAGLECITDNLTPQSNTFFRDHPDWVQRNKNGDPAIFGSGAAFWIAENSEDVWISPYAPEWRKIYMERIRQIAATGINGVYIDIPYWMTHFDGWENTWASFDTYTVAEFKRRTGINALSDFTPGDWKDPEFIAWVDFRISSMTEFMAEIDKNVKSVNPTCKTIAEIYPGIGEEATRVGADVYDMYPYVDAIAHEYNPGDNSAKRDPLEWMEYMIGMYTFRAFAEGKPSWMLSYSWDRQENILPADAIENLAMSQVMAGTNSWDARRFVMSGSNDYEARKKVYKWISGLEKLIYAPRKSIAPVGVYFSPSTRNYFSEEWSSAYLGIMNLLLEKHIEFEIVTPRTLTKAMCDVLILPDVKCLSSVEYSQFDQWLKNRKTLVYTGETGNYDDKRNMYGHNLMQDLSVNYPNVIQIKGTPEKVFYNFLEGNFNQAVYAGKYPEYDNSELNQLLLIVQTKNNHSPAVSIRNAEVCVVQIASVDNKPTIFLANFAGLRGSENANPLPAKEIWVTFHNVKRSSRVSFIPFLGQSQDIKGKWKKGNLIVKLPEILRGAIIQLK